MSKGKRCNAGSAKPTEWHFAIMIQFALQQSYTVYETGGRKRLFQKCQSLLKHLQMKVLLDQFLIHTESSNFTLDLFIVSLRRSRVTLGIVCAILVRIVI
jgi:hypothetical protein